MPVKKPVRVLQIVSSLSAGSGVLCVVLNWHRHIDSTQVQFDYLYTLEAPVQKKEEIQKLGGNYYKLPHPLHQPIKFLRASYQFFRTHRYHTIHSHITHLNLFFFPLAKWFGTKNIVQHAHGSKWSDKKINGLRNYVMLHVVWPLITHKMACSQLAGKVYFGKKFTVVNNGIDVEKFSYNTALRAQKRKELDLEHNFVVGHVGRFSREKNHSFLINIFAELVKKEPTARLVFVGDGTLKQAIEQQVLNKGLTGKVLFLGIRKDVAELYQVFDCFVLPSLHEGLGIVAIEAQAAGLPCVLSNTLPSEVFVCNCKKLRLDAPETWAQEILAFAKDFKREDMSVLVNTAGFSAAEVAKQMQDFYSGLEK